jgi:splicing factor 3A subunit 1
LLSQEAESKKRLEEANRIIREQAQSQRTVGPALPGQERKEPPTGSQEPPAKRPKVTYAPTALPPLVTVAPVPPSLPLPPPVAPVNEDPFAAAGAQPLQTGATAAANQELIPEAEFAASLAKPEVTIQIRVPNDPSQMAWNFYGQIVSLPVNIMSQVKTVKGELSTVHLNGMPANKIQLKNPVTGAFLKDGMTLAALNIGPSTTLELVPRARGGKKK